MRGLLPGQICPILLTHVTGKDFVDRVYEIGRSRGVAVYTDTKRGKGSHITQEIEMRFVYPARLQRTGPDEVVVSFRDLPECLTSGGDQAEALVEATDALSEAIAGRIDDGDPIPVPSDRHADEHDVAVPADVAAKAALMLALHESGLSRSALARRLGVDDKVVRRMLDPRHRTAASRIGAALRQLGRELVVETHVPAGVR